jgi:hypothetical protein
VAQKQLQEQRLDFNTRAFQLQSAVEASRRRGSVSQRDIYSGVRPQADAVAASISGAADAYSDLQRAINEMGTALAAAEVQV